MAPAGGRRVSLSVVRRGGAWLRAARCAIVVLVHATTVQRPQQQAGTRPSAARQGHGRQPAGRTVRACRAGELLRSWRAERGVSQLALALEAGISSRHLSFIETGRSRPSAAMVARLAERLGLADVERDHLLLAAGHAPEGAAPLDGEPVPAVERAALRELLAACEPAPALLLDAHWAVLGANDSACRVCGPVADHLLAPPVNVLRLALHPDGLAPRIANLAAWRGHMLDRLARQALATGDPALPALHAELMAYGDADAIAPGASTPDRVSVPLHLRAADGRIQRFAQTITGFGTLGDPTLGGIALATLYPVGGETEMYLRRDVHLD